MSLTPLALLNSLAGSTYLFFSGVHGFYLPALFKPYEREPEDLYLASIGFLFLASLLGLFWAHYIYRSYRLND